MIEKTAFILYSKHVFMILSIKLDKLKLNNSVPEMYFPSLLRF